MGSKNVREEAGFHYRQYVQIFVEFAVKDIGV